MLTYEQEFIQSSFRWWLENLAHFCIAYKPNKHISPEDNSTQQIVRCSPLWLASPLNIIWH